MWPDASLAHRQRKGFKHLYNRLLTKQNQEWCSHRAPESFCTSPSQLFTFFPNFHWFSAMTWREGAWSLAEVLRASCCKGLNTLQNGHHRLRVTHTLNISRWVWDGVFQDPSVAASLWCAMDRMTRSQVKSARLAPFQLRSLPTFSFESSG